MDNQLFPGGNAFLDDVPQVCPICGLMFNNTLTYQHHMQLHFLSAATNAQMLGTQPPPDPGIGLSTPASILDLIGGVSQHTLASSAAVSMVPPQAVFSGTAISTLPPHLISPGGGLATSALPNLGIPRQTPGRVKEKKSKSKSPVISSTSSSNTSSTNLLSASSTSANFKSSDSSINTYTSTFPKDLQKLDPIQSNPLSAQPIPPKPPADMFQTSSAPIDPLEALLLPSPVKQTPSVDRQVSQNSSGSPQDSFSISKDVKKLFQPFVSNDTPITASFVSKSNVPFNTNSMISPIKNTANKHDVLTTPQKSSYESNSENLFSSPPIMSNTHSSEIHHFGLLHDNETDSASVDRKLDLPTKIAHLADDSVSMKSQYFPGIVDSSSISPKSGQTARKKDVPVDPLLKMNVMTGSVDHSQSSSPVSRAALIGDFGPARPDSPRSIVSPKISPALPGGVLDTESATLPAKSHIFASDVLPSASVPSIVPPAFGNTVGANTGVSTLASPAIDMAVNPLGTGYLNALTQKLFNPSFSMGSDFNKPSSSAAPGSSDDLKGKSYFENGVLISNDYDKISDTNDEDDLDRWIDDIDNKSDNIACEIDDLLNEFNEKQTEDMKNKSQVDDFIKDVIGDPSVSKPAPKVADATLKVDDIFNPSDEFERNKSLISEILEEEKEKIDKESKELENARLSASGLFSSTSTSTSVTVSSSATTSTFTSVSNTDPKMSSSTSSEIHDKKDDDHVDFEIPKVGKLMKIRKYFENREQKRKEQTEKVAEIKIHEKTEPVIEDKPQTILVQVSKRKKIEYGPYLNRQSLLEGKPKNVENNSPPKAYRPKPKPQLPEKRTFNLRERKTKTDFATLASTGSRTAESKRLEQKQKSGEKSDKEKYNEEMNDLSVEEDKNEKTEDIVTDCKVVTRNQEKKKDSAVEEKSKPKRGNVKSNAESDNEKVKDSEVSAPENENRKFSLRTRSAKNEKTDAVEGKNLRKRTTRSDVESNSNRNKVKKTDDTEVKSGTDTEEKVTRSKSKLKTSGISSDKSGIKKCSVNLGEKYTEPKIKISKQIDKVDKKGSGSIESKNGSDKLCEENQSGKNDVDSNKNIDVNEKTEYSNESEVTGTRVTKGMDTVDGDNGNIHSENIICEAEQDNQDKDSTNPEGVDSKEGNIFDKLDQTDLKNEFEENVVHSKKSDTQLVSITSTDNTDKKVTMKLKLGPDFQKAFECVFNPKKRKHESLDETDSKAGANQSKEQSIDDITTKKDNLNEGDVNNEDSDAASNDDSKNTKTGKKMKHSVENEFQRLVDEAMKEAQKEGDSGKQERYVNLRRRLNENVKYNVDDSDEDGDKSKVMLDDIASLKTTPKGQKSQVKSTPKGKLKQDPVITESSKQLSAKKDVDVYDFTDTEMSDTDESAPKKLGFKPKYVSNLNLFGQKKLPFVSKPLSPSKSPGVENQMENSTEIDSLKMESDAENACSEISYVGKTVEPLKIKISKIKPFKEKKHKHKKKKKKREKERRDDDLDKVDSGESRESMDCDSDKLINMNVEIKNTEEIKSVDSVSQENNSNNSNEGEDEQNDGVTSLKGFKKTKMKEKKHICEYCNVGFGQKCDLRRHVMIHTGERPYPCEICDKRFQRKTDLVKHTRTHTGEKPYACEFCDKRVSDKSQLNVHRRLHTGDRPYCCSKCGKRCITSSELSRHKAVHCGEKVERCSLCRKAFTIKECLGMHMKLHYRSRGKAFKCEKCAIGFDKKTDLDSHHCIDPMKNVYMCSECYEEFNDEMLYAEHIKNHDLGVLACNVCTNIFEDKHSLETHLCSLGMEKQRQFSCEICELEFQDSDALSSHLSLHDEDVGPFMCDLCPEIFTVRKHFVEHSKVHESMVGNTTKSISSKEDTKSIKSNASSFDKGETVRNITHVTENGMMGPFKQEVDTDDVNFPAFDEKQDNRIDMAENMPINVKSEMSSASFPYTSNRSRASVISGTFRIDDEPERKQASAAAARVAFSKSNFQSDNPGMLRKVNADGFNDRSTDFLAGGNLFEPTDFTNSPDFSTLTEVDDMNSFDGLSESLTQESLTKSAKRQRSSDKGEKSVNYFDVNQKLSHYSNSSQSFGFVPSSQCSDSPVDNLSSMRVLQKQKSQISSIVTTETNRTQSSNNSQFNDRDIHKPLSTDHDFQIQDHQTKTPHSSSYPLSSQGKQWPGFSMSPSDFVNSVLSNEHKRDLDRFDSLSTSSKQNPLIQSHSKSESSEVSSSSHADIYSKDNIENQLKSNLFSEFNINTSSQKSTMQGNKHGVTSDNNPSAGSFQGLSRSGFGTSRFPQNFVSEKSDFSVFGQPYMGPYPSITSYSSSVNSSALNNSVTADVNKRHLQGLFSNRSDTLHNNFYLSDTMKDVTGADKGTDDTTSLLSNFDQF